MSEREDRRRRRRRRDWLRWTLLLGAGVVVFAVGVAVGEALHDNPHPGATITYVRTLPPTPTR